MVFWRIYKVCCGNVYIKEALIFIMLKIIKKWFQKEQEVTREEVAMDDLTSWLNKQVSFDDYLQDYFSKIASFKEQLVNKLDVLKLQEVSETEKKQVEARVCNVVSGHRDNYVREMELFCRDFIPLQMKFISIQDCLLAAKFNLDLNERLIQLAQRTAKSYQATQHLFFDQVENVFKIMGELNKLVKNFSLDIDKYEQIEDLIIDYNQSLQRKFDFEKDAARKKEENIIFINEVAIIDQKISELLESEDYKHFLKLQEEEKKVIEKQKLVEQDVFSFFAKLQKPLKKYVRVALDSKIIEGYVSESVSAFRNDEDLSILTALRGLKKSLPTLNFEKKQLMNFTTLIDNSNLLDLRSRLILVDSQLEIIKEGLAANKVMNELNELKNTETLAKGKVATMQAEIDSLIESFGKINPDLKKQEIVSKVFKVLRKDLVIL
jgi:hypothetical protein